MQPNDAGWLSTHFYRVCQTDNRKHTEFSWQNLSCWCSQTVVLETSRESCVLWKQFGHHSAQQGVVYVYIISTNWQFVVKHHTYAALLIYFTICKVIRGNTLPLLNRYFRNKQYTTIIWASTCFEALT